MKITQIVVGPIGTNCYLLCDEVQKVCAVIDPGDGAPRILSAIAESGCIPQAIYLTHGHFDHFHAVAGLLEKYPDLPVYIHEKDVEPYGTKSGWDLFFPKLEDRNQRYYAEGDTLTVGDITLTVVETPGHTPGSVCLLTGDVLFCGDTLFYASCGRTDLKGGSYPEMLRSLARLASLPGDYQCLPGHEKFTTLDFERSHNPYMKQGLAL